MFKWLADLLIKTPVQGLGCACCEAKKERLKQMQKEILGEEISAENRGSEEVLHICSGCNSEASKDETMTVSYHYKL